MKDKSVKDDTVEEVSKSDTGVEDSMAKLTVQNITKEEKENNRRQPGEDEDTSELSENLQKLNIAPDDVKDDKQNSVSEGNYTSRGPTGGIPAQPVGIMRDKNIPIGPNGNYMPPQMVYQAKMKGNRRMLDDGEDQPQKFFRPPVDPYTQMQQQQQAFPQPFGNFPQFQQNFQRNDLNQPMMNNPNMFNFGADQGFPFGGVTTTDVRNQTNMSGGKITVQSPVTNNPNPFPGLNLVDNLLEEIEHQADTSVSQGNLPSFFEGDSFKEMRRRSDPDSGIDSEGGSPWSEQAPSPSSSVYTSPPSVESGVGRSPMHESQYQHGMSPPKYPGVTSPASYRGTPSPASTSGYGSPGQPQFEDDPINELALEDAMDVINADIIFTEESKKKRQLSAPSQPPVPQMIPVSNNLSQPGMINPQMTQGLIRPPVMMPQMQGQPMPPNSGFLPVTTSGAPHQIIILPPPQQQNANQLIFVPVQTSPAPQKKTGQKKQYVKILPKISQQSTSSPGGSSITSTNNSGQTSVTMSHKVGSTPNRNQSSQHANEQNNKLLMIARRTVAGIPREDLRKSDDEGDTYLHIAVCKTDKHMVQALLERLHREKLDSLVDEENVKRQTPLYLAVFINQPVMVAMFIKFAANVNVLAQNLSSDGSTTEVKAAIHVAASQGVDYHRTLIELLKAKDIQINTVNNYGQTALHCAILAHGKPKRNGQDRINSSEIIKTLIKHGADPSAQDKKSGKTPLMYAIEQKNLELVDTILRTVHPDKVKNVVKTQAFDGSSCLKIAEGLKGSLEVEIWNKLWNSLQSAANGSMTRYQYSAQMQPVF